MCKSICLLAIVGGLLALLGAGAAHAQAPKSPFEQGLALYEQGDRAGALEQLSGALPPHPRDLPLWANSMGLGGTAKLV